METGKKVLRVTGITGQYAGRYDSGLSDEQFKSFEDLRAMLSNYIPGAAKMSIEELQNLGVAIEYVNETIYATGEDYENYLIKEAEELSNRLKDNGTDLEGVRAEYDKVTAELARFAQAHDVLGDKNTKAKAALDKLNKAYDEASNRITYYVNGLIREQKQAGKTGDQIYNLVKRMIVLNEKS